MRIGAGATFQIKTPAKCHIRLIRHGEVVAEIIDDTHLTYHADDPGAYRVECSIPFHNQLRGWIYSNPIYLLP